MARAEVVHSTQAVKVIFKGDPRRPEPPTAVIEFPGGHVEVSRTTDGDYWAHIEVVAPANVKDGRIDYDERRQPGNISVADLPGAEHVAHIAVLVTNTKPRVYHD